MYFNVQRVRKPGLRTSFQGQSSTYFLSQNAGQVKMASVFIAICLSKRVQSKLPNAPHQVVKRTFTFELLNLLGTHAVGGAKSAQPPSRLLYARPSLRSFISVKLPTKPSPRM
jgi:hypothetical protein